MLPAFVHSCCLTRLQLSLEKRRKTIMMQIIANLMPFAILHTATLQASRATPNLQHWQSKYTKLCPHPRLAAQQPRNHLTSLCLNCLQGTPFPLRSARLFPLPLPLLPEVPCPPFYPLHEDHFNRTPCATDFLRIPMPCAVGGQWALSASFQRPSHLLRHAFPSKSHTCLHPSLHPALETSCP